MAIAEMHSLTPTESVDRHTARPPDLRRSVRRLRMALAEEEFGTLQEWADVWASALVPNAS
jgi:hypothetical protein